MTRLPDLEDALRKAAERMDRGIDTADATPVASPRHRLRLPLLVGLATFGIAGGAVAATGLLDSGDPVPDKAPAYARLGEVAPGSSRLLPLRAADPDGGPAWAIRLFRIGTENQLCVQAGRVQGGDLGVVGRDGMFNDDGKFHALPPTAEQVGVCGPISDEGQLWMVGNTPPIPASGQTGRPTKEIGGCTERVADPAATQSAETRRRLADVPVCSADSLRVVKYGFAGAEATEVTYGNGAVEQHANPDPGTSGAYLFVLPKSEVGSEPLTLSVTYRDGTVCHMRGNDGVEPTKECMPPPGVTR